MEARTYDHISLVQKLCGYPTKLLHSKSYTSFKCPIHQKVCIFDSVVLVDLLNGIYN